MSDPVPLNIDQPLIPLAEVPETLHDILYDLDGDGQLSLRELRHHMISALDGGANKFGDFFIRVTATDNSALTKAFQEISIHHPVYRIFSDACVKSSPYWTKADALDAYGRPYRDKNGALLDNSINKDDIGLSVDEFLQLYEEDPVRLEAQINSICHVPMKTSLKKLFDELLNEDLQAVGQMLGIGADQDVIKELGHIALLLVGRHQAQPGELGMILFPQIALHVEKGLKIDNFIDFYIRHNKISHFTVRVLEYTKIEADDFAALRRIISFSNQCGYGSRYFVKVAIVAHSHSHFNLPMPETSTISFDLDHSESEAGNISLPWLMTVHEGLIPFGCGSVLDEPSDKHSGITAGELWALAEEYARTGFYTTSLRRTLKDHETISESVHERLIEVMRRCKE